MVLLATQGTKYKDLYEQFVKKNSAMSFNTFRRKMVDWKQKYKDDVEILEAANLAYKFVPHASTVQVNGKGEILQAWIKQQANDRTEEILEAIKANIQPADVKPAKYEPSDRMLEIPLFDMHFGIAFLEFYAEMLAQILAIIEERRWDKIVILVGQDLFHNDSVANGITTKGTLIEKVDLQRAVEDAEKFYFRIIDAAIANSNSVEVIYTQGNHDKTVGWMFSRILKQKYHDIVDDTIKNRKAVLWKRCFIGFTHGEKKNDTPQGLRGKFTIEFPVQFAEADVREIHTGHLHRESCDEFGVVVRRMACGNMNDSWTDEEGYKSIKRFMLFEWAPGRLKAIHYIQ